MTSPQRAFVWPVLALVAGCASGPRGGEKPAAPAPPPAAVKPAQQPALARCAAPLATVIVIEAQPDGGGMAGMGGMGGMGGMQGDPYARLHVPPLVQIARTLAENSACFRALEADPALLAIPGGVQPELALRVRAASIRLVERSLIEKAGSAAKRYIGRYTGGGDSDPDALQSVEVSLDIVCPKQKRVAQTFKGVADGPLGEPGLTGGALDTIAGANHERMAVAYAKAQDAALLYLRAKPKPCD